MSKSAQQRAQEIARAYPHLIPHIAAAITEAVAEAQGQGLQAEMATWLQSKGTTGDWWNEDARDNKMTEEWDEFTDALVAGDREQIKHEGGDLMNTIAARLAFDGIDEVQARRDALEAGKAKHGAQ